MSRDTFLARVRDAVVQGNAHRVHLQEIPEGTGYVGAEGDLCEALVAEVREVGGEAEVVDSWESAREALKKLLQRYEAKSALCWRHEMLDRLGLTEFLKSCDVEQRDHDSLCSVTPDERKAKILSADIGITSVDHAIAETGTLVVFSRPGQERVASLLPPVHVAIVHRQQILPDLFDVIRKVNDAGFENLPSNITLITGPSKTGDIELQLTTGVHGPGNWHVIVVRG